MVLTRRDDPAPPIRPEQLTRPKPVLDFDTFFHTEYQRLFQTMYLLVGDRAQAEDIAQEAMARTCERWRLRSGPSRRRRRATSWLPGPT
jgi:DNA-directed RNA polymerase specialized sigma24 family protein